MRSSACWHELMSKTCAKFAPAGGNLSGQKGEKSMETKEVIATQVRLPSTLHEYIKNEATRLGIAQNALLVVLLDLGRRAWEADINLREKL